MINTVSIIGMVFSVLMSIGVPVATLIIFQKKFKRSVTGIAIGMAGYLLFALILERFMHTYFLQLNTATAALFAENAVAYGLYGGFAAGIFEETARLLAFIFILKKGHDWAGGISYGIGHGGIEAVMVGGIASLNNLLASIMINTGGVKIGAEGGVTADQLEAQINVANSSGGMFFVGGFERLMAFIIQIGLSLLVLYAVRNKKLRFFFLAIVFHAAINFPAALFQKGIVDIWFPEVWVLLFAAAACLWVLKSYKDKVFEGEITAGKWGF